ncbi:MAG: EamA family transporter [Limnohabitans sp.]|uniref:EamA family transporter n=1 Tax=Limnohabitans sp. TaxID=1907725 RepID=UPI0035B38035
MPGATPHTSWAVAGLLLNAFVWGLSWWPFKQLEALGLHPLWATAIVYGLSFAAIALWIGHRRVHIGWRQHTGLWWLLIASGLTNVGFNWAVTVGDVVRVVLLFYLMPAWSVLVAWWLLGDRPTPGALLRLLLALSGLVIVLHRPDSPWPVPESLADVLALLGGLSFAVTNALLFKLKDTPESSRMLAMFGGGAFMAALTALLGSGSAVVVQSVLWQPGWIGPVLLLTFAFLAGNIALQYGAARLPAHTTALVMLSEVVFASVSSVILGVSTWDLRTLLGGALILLAAVLSVVMPGRAQH